MDFSRLEINRRTALLTSAAIAANVINPLRAFAAETPRKGGVFKVHYGAEQRQLNPSIQASTGVYIIGGKIQEALIDLDAAGKPVGVLAESWESSPDGKTITFKLRKGVTWHDGKPFTSADVAFTAMNMWKKILNYGTTLQLFLTSVDTPDAHTAVFNYERPMPLDLLLRALPDLGYVSAKHLYENGDIRQNPVNLAPVGTGPFKFVKYERGQYIIADRNENYWRPNMPYLDRIVWRVITDRSAAAAQLEAGDLHYSPFSGLTISDMARLGKDKRFIVSTKGNEGNARTNTLEFNFRTKELADIKVRRAIAHAINVPFFIDNFLGDFAKLGTGPIPSTSTDFYPGADAPQYPYDKAKANALLDEAGFKKGADGKRFSLRLLPAPWGEDISLWATFVQQSLSEVGIPVEVVRNDGGGFLKQVYSDHAFDLATGWHQYRNDPAVSTTVWYRSGQPAGAPWTNQWGWTDPTIDKIIDSAATELDPVKRKALYADFVTRANTELPVWMPIEQIFVTVISTKARNHSNTPRWGSSTWHDLWLAE
ncbi:MULTISPECIES: ABC transporter substrate-binding protein [Rhodopseudomonas]|uniref:Peptide ABC transporter substrate-binding protein n=1 Tax=Rhodopseudomonas palustris TaxID=1076 RepID=A0A0D7E154_RHOPL|nr:MULTISPECIES: ABC transporter substrate-binding protein [Rhodopseudomonas]KIZ34221.1 peptide ABC transporter substrate-binding protein [Rhodopseudomonas palustris]MDF3810802.1 ABC transporter substrate-binding protein [Rhodopseudomonas sp. BAL398]WOK17324.1 ABC transporter substrate-binding protein [Rhodopseudomonas sp. BAL398]